MSNDVLIPRPDSEVLVEAVLERARIDGGWRKDALALAGATKSWP